MLSSGAMENLEKSSRKLREETNLFIYLFPFPSPPLYTCIRIVPVPFSLQVYAHLLYQNHISFTELARPKYCSHIKHCKNSVHLTCHSILETIYHCTRIHNNNFVAQTKVLCLRRAQSHPFKLNQYNQTDHCLATKLTSQIVICYLLLVWQVSHESVYALRYAFL